MATLTVAWPMYPTRKLASPGPTLSVFGLFPTFSHDYSEDVYVWQSAKRSRSASILEALQKADLPVLESYHNHELPLSRVHLLNTLIKLADRELVYLINWAKHVPG